MKTVEYNDIDLEKFQEYKHIQTGTVWNSDVNVYSQILDRYTRQNDIVLNLFGLQSTNGENHTTITNQDICNTETINRHRRYIEAEFQSNQAKNKIQSELKKVGNKQVQLIILEPTYLDYENGLKNFYDNFSNIAKFSSDLLENNRFICLIIQDYYTNQSLEPISYKCAEIVEKLGFRLKSVNIKMLKKEGEHKLFQYRALCGGFNIFEHEYVIILQKIKK